MGVDWPLAFARLDAFVAGTMQADNIPGLAIGITDRARLLHVATYGYADVAARAPITPKTLFEIGSIGKSFTSILLLQEMEQGRLDLHAPVSRYLPWFAVQSAYEPITVHHLLSHSAGITEGSDFAPDSPAEVWALRETATGAPPGQYFHYSNAGYKALGLVLERLLGQPYAQTLATRILEPLEMRATAPAITNAIRDRLAVGYHPYYDDRPAPPGRPFAPAPWLETTTADGSLASTPADMAAYLRMLLNRGQGPRGRILAESSFDLLTGRVIPAWGLGFYGYGLLSLELDGHAALAHGGDMPGFMSTMAGDLDEGLGVIVLANGPANCREIAEYTLRLCRAALHDGPLPPVPPRPDRTGVERAADYAGTYRAGGKSFTLRAEDSHLVLQQGGTRTVLEQRGPDCFYAAHPDFARFLLRFGRAGEGVVEAFHGADWYVNDRYTGPAAFGSPPEWDTYPGHYRAHNPWVSNFRVVLRKGALTLISAPGAEVPLAPDGAGVFRVGADAEGPERLSFSTPVEGQALQATLAMCPYYRFFTP